MSSLDIAPTPEDCGRSHGTLPQGLAPVTGVFPAGVYSHHLEIGLQAIKLSPYHAGPPTPRPIRLGTRAGFSGMLLSPFSFEAR